MAYAHSSGVALEAQGERIDPDGLAQSLEAHLFAVSRCERALQLDPSHARALACRHEAGLALGRIALLGADYGLARQAFEDLLDYGGDESAIAEYLRLVSERQSAVLRARRQRLESMVADIRAGLGREGRGAGAPLLDDLVWEAATFRDPQTVEILGAALAELSRKAEEQAAAAQWSLTERDLAVFACRVCGRIGLPLAVEPLARFLLAVEDVSLQIEAGEALGNTRAPAAYAVFRAFRLRVRADSFVWRRVQPFAERIPRPSAGEDASAQDIRALAMATYEADEYVQAIELYGRALELEPDHVGAINTRGLCWLGLGKLENAIADFSRAIEIDPQEKRAWLNRGTARASNGQAKLALADYDRAIEIDPRWPDPLVNRGILHIAERRLDEAIADFTAAIEADPRSPVAHVNRAYSHYLRQDRDEALADLGRAIELDPRSAAAYDFRAAIQNERGNPRAALGDHDQAIESDPSNPMFLVNRAKTRLRLGDPRGAIVDCDNALARGPRLAPAFVNRGEAHRALGEFDAARADLAKAIELAPVLWQAYVALAQVEGDADDREACARAFADAIPRVPPEHRIGVEEMRRKYLGE